MLAYIELFASSRSGLIKTFSLDTHAKLAWYGRKLNHISKFAVPKELLRLLITFSTCVWCKHRRVKEGTFTMYPINQKKFISHAATAHTHNLCGFHGILRIIDFNQANNSRSLINGLQEMSRRLLASFPPRAGYKSHFNISYNIAPYPAHSLNQKLP
jgi:hypothetical protein